MAVAPERSFTRKEYVMNGKNILVCMIVVLMSIPVWAAGSYEANWESLANHTAAPEWFQDAKFGIYFHWGVYSVPAYGSEWYPRNMHRKNGREYQHHLASYGDPTDFGYHDFVPLFKAEHFDAEAWAALFVKAGARFAGPVAEHHDGYSMWASDVTPWNTRDTGPKRDITGELAKAIRGHNMRFIATFHHARNNLWEKSPGKWTGHYDLVKKDFPTLLENPKHAILYGYMPRDKFEAMWKAKLVEVIDKYQPDIMWFDSWLHEISESVRQEYAAYYLNKAAKWNKEVVICRKQDDLPLDFTVLDHEKSRMSGASDHVWMTDDTISTGSWCYTSNLKIKPTRDVIHAMIDTVSKNGIVLLNISPLANGLIPQDQQQVLLEIGRWIGIHGEAIYKTRPWLTYGEGPTKEPKGGFREHAKFLKLKYNAQDIRYTRSKDGKTVYAMLLGRPGVGKTVTLQSFASGEIGANTKVAAVKMLGSSERISWRQDDKGLQVVMPSKVPEEMAVALKISVIK